MTTAKDPLPKPEPDTSATVTQKAQPRLPELGERRNVLKEEVKLEIDRLARGQVNTKTVLFTLYLLYKTNMITRNHLRILFKTINEANTEEDLGAWLVKEAAK